MLLSGLFCFHIYTRPASGHVDALDKFSLDKSDRPGGDLSKFSIYRKSANLKKKIITINLFPNFFLFFSDVATQFSCFPAPFSCPSYPFDDSEDICDEEIPSTGIPFLFP